MNIDWISLLLGIVLPVLVFPVARLGINKWKAHAATTETPLDDFAAEAAEDVLEAGESLAKAKK